MAKITKLPSLETIDGFRGVLDFYVYMGIPVVRKWPRKIGSDRSASVQATWVPFTSLAKSWPLLSAAMKERYDVMASGAGLTGKDWYFRLGLTTNYWGVT